MIRVLQINVNRSVAAHDMADYVAKKKDIDILAFTEPNLRKTGGKYTYANEGKTAVIINTSLRYKFIEYLYDKCFVACVSCAFVCYSVYISPNCVIREFQDCLEPPSEIVRAYKRQNKKIIITGDFNARNS